MISYRFRPGARVELTEDEWLEEEGGLIELRSDTPERDGTHFSLEDIRRIQAADLIETYEVPDPKAPGEALYTKTVSIQNTAIMPPAWKDLGPVQRAIYAKAEAELKMELVRVEPQEDD